LRTGRPATSRAGGNRVSAREIQATPPFSPRGVPVRFERVSRSNYCPASRIAACLQIEAQRRRGFGRRYGRNNRNTVPPAPVRSTAASPR
jgi:hypothetical protein